MSLVYINNCTPHRPGSSCSWFPVWQKTSLVRYRVYNDISPSFSTRINSYEFHWMGNIDRNWINLAPTSLAINLCHKKFLALTHTLTRQTRLRTRLMKLYDWASLCLESWMPLNWGEVLLLWDIASRWQLWCASLLLD